MLLAKTYVYEINNFGFYAASLQREDFGLRRSRYFFNTIVETDFRLLTTGGRSPITFELEAVMIAAR